MRKPQQKKILSMLQTISRIQSAESFAECQTASLEIGEYIESIEGEGTQTVTLLEEYCDLLFKAHNGEIGQKQLRKHLIKVENSVRSELKPNRIEVVFIPYKRAMSDSLESIWQEALKDPQCDCYIIPVPYYDRLPDKSFGQMHYEGNLYPPDLHITDWREYDFDERRPDVIFTHFSYDEENSVTSLHPNFYSERLRVLTELLVYVPYFVNIDGISEEMCDCYGVMFPHKTIVDSEKARQTYIRVLKKIEKEDNCKGFFGKPEEKFIALGSPKYDAVICAKPEDFDLPEEWRSVIEKPDGTRKKIVLYNTSINASLKNSEQYLKKIRFVLDSFRERDDVVLWWRPHPLIETTYQLMRPALLEEYKHIVTDYLSDSWGIFDDTPDLHRAIMLTNAYYGDGSSLVAIYQCTGNPIMLQNANEVVSPEDSAQHTVELSPQLFYKDPSSCLNHRDCYYYESSKLPFQGFLMYVLEDSLEKTAMAERQIGLRKGMIDNPDATAGYAIYSYSKRHVMGYVYK